MHLSTVAHSCETASLAPAEWRIDRWLPIALALLSLAVRLGVLFHADYMFDDPFIAWRVARNLAEGNGAVYNLGDRVQAFSSPLHMVFCGGLWWLFGAKAIFIDRVCACVVDACSTWLVADFALHAGTGSKPARVLGSLSAGIFHAFAAQCAFVAAAGLETAFYSFTILQACSAAGRARFAYAAMFAAGSVLLRPDGWICLLVVVSIACVAGHGRRALVPILMVVVPWTIAQWAYYGTLVPQTVTAKNLVERSASAEWGELLRELFTGGLRQIATGATIALGASGTVRDRAKRPLLLWCVVYASAFSTVGAWWPWYWSPLVAAMAPLLGDGASSMFDFLAHRLPGRGVTAIAGLAVVVFANSLIQQTRARANWGRSVAPFYREQNLRMAAWLEQNGDKSKNLLLERIGELAFHSTLRIDDYPGLVSRQVTDALVTLKRPVAWGPSDTGASGAVLRRVRPHYLLLRRDEYTRARAARLIDEYGERTWFAAHPRGTSLAPDYQDMVLMERAPDR